MEDGDEKKLKTYYDKFEDGPKSNKIYNRYVFKSRVQNENESLDQFVTELKTLIKDCDYPAATTDEHIRDHIVFGVRSSAIRKKLILEGSDLTLAKCLDIAHPYELSLPQAQAIGNQASNGAVDAINHNRGRGRGRARGKVRGSNRQSRDQMNHAATRQPRDQVNQGRKCDYCGNNKHKTKTDCPAYGKQCHKCSKYKHFANMKDDAVPVVCPTRKVSFGLQDKLKTELDSMEAKQVICRVTEPSNWVHSLVCVEKPYGKLRLCLDPMALNDNVKSPYFYPMRSIDDITSQLSGANYFSVFDATKGYWAIRLDKPSSMQTTFNTPFKKYRYLRLPMGIRSAQDMMKFSRACKALPRYAMISWFSDAHAQKMTEIWRQCWKKCRKMGCGSTQKSAR